MTEVAADQNFPAPNPQPPRKVSRNGLAIIVLCGLAIMYLGYNMVVGDRGILAWFRLSNEITKAQLTLDLVQTDKLNIERKVIALHPENIDPDMLEERVRTVLGLGRPSETIILLHRTETPWPVNAKQNTNNNKQN